MAEMRWLLNVSIPPEQEQAQAQFEIWLHKLDEQDEQTPVCVTTVDELVSVLVAAWQKRRVTPPPTTA